MNTIYKSTKTKLSEYNCYITPPSRRRGLGSTLWQHYSKEEPWWYSIQHLHADVANRERVLGADRVLMDLEMSQYPPWGGTGEPEGCGRTGMTEDWFEAWWREESVWAARVESLSVTAGVQVHGEGESLQVEAAWWCRGSDVDLREGGVAGTAVGGGNQGILQLGQGCFIVSPRRIPNVVTTWKLNNRADRSRQRQGWN